MVVIELLYVVGGLVAVLVVWGAMNRSRVEHLRQQGIYPAPGQETEADVERLLSLGHKIEAIKVYRAIHGVGLKEAKEAVERIAARPKI